MMNAFKIRNAMIALALVASFLLVPARSNAQVKSTAAKLGFKAAKIEVVFHDAVKLTESIQKVSYRAQEEPSEIVKQYLARLFEEGGVEMTDEAGDEVKEITFYIGIDDADDDNDGIPDATDTQDFTGEAPADVKDADIKTVDLDQEDAAVRALPNTNKSQGIYVLVVNSTDERVTAFTMDGDVLGTYADGEGPSARVNLFGPAQPRFESNHASLMRPQFGVMMFPGLHRLVTGFNF